MRENRSGSQLIFFAVLCALIAGVAVALLIKHQQSADAATQVSAARLQRVDGEVAIKEFTSQETSEAVADNWLAGRPNQPVSTGDRIHTRGNGRASLAFTGRNFARLDPNTSLDVLSLGTDRTQLALRNGSSIFDVGYLAPGEVFEVATPYGAIDINEPGLYSVDLNNEGAIISVLSGLAQVVGLAGTGQISKGEVLTLLGQTAANLVLSRVDGNDAGYLLDDYYRYQYPDIYDGRYRDYDAYLADPFYYDPYRQFQSYQYASSYIPGLSDLDYYGDWQNVSGYGYGWRPRVDSGWAPYQQGYWMTDSSFGPTWVSTEPWGYAPYHYGRWANRGQQWYWIPDRINTTPTYAPALVAFIPQSRSNEIGWVPLGPGDSYAPRYYDENWHPSYLGRTNLEQRHVQNLDVENAVTIVPLDDFGRMAELRRFRRSDRRRLGDVQAVLDPLTFTPLRNAALRSAWARDKIDLPPGIRRKLRDTSVLTSSDLEAPRFRRDLARNFGVESVPDKVRNRRLKFRDERNERRDDDETRLRDLENRRQQRLRLTEEQREGLRQWRSRRNEDRSSDSRERENFERASRQQRRFLEQQQRQGQIEQWRARRNADQESERRGRENFQRSERQQRRILEQQQRQAQVEQWRARRNADNGSERRGREDFERSRRQQQRLLEQQQRPAQVEQWRARRGTERRAERAGRQQAESPRARANRDGLIQGADEQRRRQVEERRAIRQQTREERPQREGRQRERSEQNSSERRGRGRSRKDS